jgi:hypothetical protein
MYKSDIILLVFRSIGGLLKKPCNNGGSMSVMAGYNVAVLLPNMQLQIPVARKLADGASSLQEVTNLHREVTQIAKVESIDLHETSPEMVVHSSARTPAQIARLLIDLQDALTSWGFSVGDLMRL